MSINNYQFPVDVVLEKMEISHIVVCHVCCNEGAHKHFGGICCAPCKMFFRRNAQYNLETSICHFGGHCDLRANSRHLCRICRFKKCLSTGMQKELIRASRLPSRHHATTCQHTQARSVIYTLDLLENDRSLLTKDQWNFLSNVVHAYDDTSPVSNIRDTLNRHSTYPLKIRMKIATDDFLNVISSVFRAVGPFFDKLPHFSALHIRDKNELMQRHLRTVGGFGGVFILREANVCADPIYKNSFAVHYGPEIYEEGLRVADRHELDGSLIKIFIATLFFSTCTDLVQQANYSHHHNNITSNHIHFCSNTKYLMKIQNIYVETIFKYMLYRYGFRDTTLRFAAIIKNFLDQGSCLIKAGEQYQVQNIMIEKIRSDIIGSSISHNELAQ